VNRQIGVRDFKYAETNCPLRIGHVIRRMRSGCKRIVNDILWEMSELITQERIAVGSSYLVEELIIDPPCMATDQGQNVKGQGHKVT